MNLVIPFTAAKLFHSISSFTLHITLHIKVTLSLPLAVTEYLVISNIIHITPDA